MIHEIALTIKPTMACNMKCKHCFNGDEFRENKMVDIEKVYNFIEAACKENKDVKVTFHGGEPTLAGMDFYKKIFDFEEKMHSKYDSKFTNNFTTNGLLLKEELIDLLIKNNTLINVSFDGPYNYCLRENSEIVYKRICSLKEKNADFRVFCTISKHSYENLIEIYKWFNERKINFKILPIEPRGYAALDKDLLMDTDKFIDVLSEAYRYWATDEQCDIKVYTFEEFARFKESEQFKPYWFNREIALNPDGKIYPFGRPNDIQFCLGDSSESLSIKQCFNSDAYKKMLKKLNHYMLKYCEGCDSKSICNGVCISMSYMYVEDEELLKHSCNQANKIFDCMKKINKEIERDFLNGNYNKYNKRIKLIFGEKLYGKGI